MRYAWFLIILYVTFAWNCRIVNLTLHFKIHLQPEEGMINKAKSSDIPKAIQKTIG